jgi:hypothetical protein
VVGWNLTQTNGFFLQFVLVEGVEGFDNIYRPLGSDIHTGSGSVTIDELHQIQAIVFFGTNVVPENGATIILLGFAAGLSLFLAHLKARGRVLIKRPLS